MAGFKPNDKANIFLSSLTNMVSRIDLVQEERLPLRKVQCVGKLRRNCPMMKRKANGASQGTVIRITFAG